MIRARPELPSWETAPPGILDALSNCGPLSMWIVLTALKKPLDVQAIFDLCHFKGDGTKTVAMAVAFKALGFRTEYRAEGLTMNYKLFLQEIQEELEILPPLGLAELLELPAITIISYDTFDGSAHLSPVTKLESGSVLLALEEIEVQALGTIESRRVSNLMESISVFY